ncbi:MAG: hypothetical protein LQ342_005575 [Letrouitia transgressa]|nr:MAG: hypothetical protein LQ342_005575 [Letrouitia transgressa]
MSIDPANARLIPQFEAHKHTLHLIHRYSKLSPTRGVVTQDPEADDLRTQIHQRLRAQEEEFELFRQEFEDQKSSDTWSTRRESSAKERERTDLAAQVARLGEDLKLAHSRFRKAQLQVKRNVEAARRKEREALFAGRQEANGEISLGRRKGQERLSKDETVLNASSDVTAGLRRVYSLMQSEVSRSQFAQETLEQSTAALSTLSESYNNLDSLLLSSRSLVSTLLYSQKSDTWYLETTFFVLVCTIAWLVFRRIFYGPGWWLVYLPVSLTWRVIRIAAHFLLGASASLVGALGGASQSTSLARLSKQASTSLIIKPSAATEIPRFKPGMSAPSIAVGGGGKSQNSGQPSEDQSMLDKVGQMAEESQQRTNEPPPEPKQGTVLRERGDDEPPNPKKRMWEERTNVQGEETRQRDEL